jgi:8-oxo-dGTP pyrophosphatase MutT (NUDIX family)
MWLITNFGFFSVVRKPDDHTKKSLTIRARAKSDLENLRKKYLPQMSAVVEGGGTDYKYRTRVSQSDFAKAMEQIALDVDYSNFKDSVAKTQGSGRSHLYHKVWSVLYELQETEAKAAPVVKKPRKGTVRLSYGGVLFDQEGRVLVRKPKNEFDNYVWTFPKGRAEQGSTPERTALREVLEETGYNAEIVGKVPGSFAGGTGNNEYFLMRPLGKPDQFDPKETEAIMWVPWEEAPKYIEQTRNKTGRKRDLAVLRAAVAEYQKLFGNAL